MQHLAKLLGRAPDGREIFRYRVTDEAYAHARGQLQRLLASKELSAISDESAAVFCVVGAEWWRREHKSGPWAWDGILRSLGAPRSPYGEVIKTVARGLEVLDRPLLTNEHSRQYLVTLACEGGLPLQRLEVENASLRLFFRALLEHFEATGITGDEDPSELARVARLFERRMPVALQHDVVFRLTGELVGRAWRLRRELGTETRDPVRLLDETTPGWRDTLPLLLTDRTAEALLQGLMTDVARVAQGQSGRVRFVTRLTLPRGDSASSGEGAVLTRALSSPLTLSASALIELFGERPEGARLYLRVRNESGGTLRVGALSPAGAEGWSWQPLPGAALSGSAATEQLVLEVITRHGRPLESASVEGSGRLGPLPWVFRRLEGRVWELVGIGSTTRREEELLVALLPEMHIEGDAQRLTEVSGRTVYRVTGEITIALETGTTRVRAGQPANGAQRFELQGRTFSGMDAPGRIVWQGLPRLRARHGVSLLEAPLEVKAEGRWRPVRGDEFGALDVRAQRDGEVVFQERLLVAPADLVVRLEIGAGERPGVVDISSQRLSDAGVREEPSWTLKREVGLPRVRVSVLPTGRTPNWLPLRLAFGGAVLDGSVPFPFQGMRFEGADGNELASGTPLHIDHLGGIRAVGLAPAGRASFRLTLTAQLPDGDVVAERTFALVQQSTGEHALRLRDLEPELLGLMGATERLDGIVRASLWQTGGSGDISVVIRRYDWRLRPDHDLGDVVLEGRDGDAPEDTVVEARPFADIARVEQLPRLRSARLPEPRWVFGPEHRCGPWLVTCREGGWYRCRPVAFTGRKAKESESSGLEAISEIRAEPERLAALQAHLSTLAQDWGHTDWSHLEAHARLLGDLPAATFDVIRSLVRLPQIVALLAVRCASWAPTELVAVIDGLEELAFSWSLVPIDAWEHAFGMLHGTLATIAPEHAIREVEARAMALGSWVFPALVAFHRWARRTGNNHGLVVPNDVSSCMTSDLIGVLLTLRQGLRIELLQRHADETWPGPPRNHPSVGPRCSMGKGDLGEHLVPVLDAPVLAALMAARSTLLDVPSTLFVKAARSFDEEYFDPCFRLSFSAIVASQGV